MHANCLLTHSGCVAGHKTTRSLTFPHNQRCCPCFAALRKLSKPQHVMTSKQSLILVCNRGATEVVCCFPFQLATISSPAAGFCAAAPARMASASAAAAQAEPEQVFMFIPSVVSLTNLLTACGFCSCGSSSSLTLMPPFLEPLHLSNALKMFIKQQQPIRESWMLPKCTLQPAQKPLQCALHY